MKRLITLSVATVAFWVWSPTHAQSPTDIAEGARVWANNCTRCHNARSPLERSDRQWTTIVAHMRARANLTRSEAALVTTYLQLANAPEASSPAPNVAEKESPAIGHAVPGTLKGPEPRGKGELEAGDSAGAQRIDRESLEKMKSLLEKSD